jgi:hypothetical protein
MALTQLQITYHPETDCVKAELILDGEHVEEKNLTNVEMEGLADFIDFELPTQILDAQEVYRWVTEECWFDTDGEPTNLELMLEEHLP